MAQNYINAESARIFSQDIHDNGALAKLDLSGNYTIEAWRSDHDSPGFIRPIAGMLKTNTSIKALVLSSNKLNAEAGRIFSDQVIQDNGALASSLNLANNNLGAEGAQHLAKVLPTW